MLYPLFVLRHVPCFRSTFSVPSCHRPRAHRSKSFGRLFLSDCNVRMLYIPPNDDARQGRTPTGFHRVLTGCPAILRPASPQQPASCSAPPLE
jgi:hypothetical protein